MILQVLFAFNSSLDRVKLPLPHLPTFSAGPSTFLIFHVITFFIASKPVLTYWNRWSNHHKFPTAFVDFQQQFFSNRSKKAKLPANCILLAQNLTYLMLKKTMLFILRQNYTYWKLKPHDDALVMKVATIWPDAIVLVTPSLENPLRLIHTPNIINPRCHFIVVTDQKYI